MSPDNVAVQQQQQKQLPWCLERTEGLVASFILTLQLMMIQVSHFTVQGEGTVLPELTVQVRTRWKPDLAATEPACTLSPGLFC